MKNPSVMTHNFSRVPTVSHPRSVFNRSHGHKTTFDAGWLIPCYVDEVLPGDTVNMHCSILVRLLSAAVRPFMDNLFLDTFWFYVPNRLLWTNFVKFMGEQNNPTDSISYTVPQITSPNVAGGGIPVGHLFDYFGLPTGPLNGGGATTGLTVNNLHGRAYNQIWNTWFRSQDLQNSVTVDVGDGPDTWSNYNLLRRGKRFDYFTSALPWPLKGGIDVALPLSGTAQVKGTGTDTINFSDGVNLNNFLKVTSGNTTVTMNANSGATTQLRFSAGNVVGLYTDLTTATATTVNALRQSITVQQFLERDARGGTRYPELIANHFGVKNPDSRVQRPELLATYSSPLRVTPVSSTMPTELAGTSSMGTLGAFGTGSFVGHGFTKSFTEHGVIIGLMSVRADITYQLGVNRMWNRRTRYDYYWPIFANLGEQSILNREIYANLADGSGAAQKDGVFGYIPRYDEYRFKPSLITGTIRSTAAGSLDVWHLSQEFSAQPTLGATFIQEDPPVDRVIMVPAEAHFIADCFFSIKHARPMPMFSVPGLARL